MSVGPDDDLSARDLYYIRASGPSADAPRLVVKHDDAFLVADRHGDCPDLPQQSEFGFYVGGTRFLRKLALTVHGQYPLLLNAAVANDGRQIAADLTNPDLCHGDTVVLPARTFRLARTIAVQSTTLSHRLAIESFSSERHELALSWRFAADFVDVFEVRGLVRERRGDLLPPVVTEDSVRLSYRGLDGVIRLTTLRFDPRPAELAAGVARYRIPLAPKGQAEIGISVEALDRADVPPPVHSRRTVRSERTAEPTASIHTAHEQMNAWVARASHDLAMLTTDTADGPIAYAGIPWYVAPFGRDSLITALQALPFDPALARGTLRFLARHQATENDDFTDQEPGKILHEYRQGEMAACREIAFVPYYGSVDATPLFLMLLTEYLRWTDDAELARELWPAVERALGWLREPGERGDQYLTYARRSPRGLANQGWKDSQDAIMHADGTSAIGPIALVEAQGYKIAALRGGAEVAEILGRSDLAGVLAGSAARLSERFERDYWLEKEGFYALALDGEGQPCRVISSNPGHALWTRTIAPERAAAVAVRLTAPEVFSGGACGRSPPARSATTP